MRNIEAKPSGDSWGYKGRWQVNCVNMWAATLGSKLTLENAIFEHNVIVIHEISHTLSGVRRCWSEKDVYSWDRFIEGILK